MITGRTNSAKWARVSREKPCPICGKPDWCLRSDDGTAAICGRVESPRRVGDAGWMHRLVDDPQPWQRHQPRTRYIPLTRSPGEDLARLAEQYRRAVDPQQLEVFAESLGLPVDALEAQGVGWSKDHNAWSLPMTDASGRVLGIRLRKWDGFKFSVRGGKEGLFLPIHADDHAGSQLIICEGVTDAAALWALGFRNIVGRPSCTGGVKHITELVRIRKPASVAIIADGDEPGLRGARNLASVLVTYAPAVAVLAPPVGVKDVRAWVRAGATLEQVQAAIDAAPVRRLTVKGGGR